MLVHPAEENGLGAAAADCLLLPALADGPLVL
jgi:hypothetical protein